MAFPRPMAIRSRLVKTPWQRLREQGILGMNQRNGDYIMPFNPRRLYPLVDDKRRTKELALAAGISVPDLYGMIEIESHIRHFKRLIGEHSDFVIKPSHGSGGNGIMVITDSVNGHYRRANGLRITLDDIEHHLSNILSGMYSLGGLPDSALLEYRVEFDPLFEEVSYQGVPDIRTIVFRGVPVMAMVRLPTRMSDGKANLHQGAVGVGIDLASGCITSGVWLEKSVAEHPDTGAPIHGLQIPHWDMLLQLAARCHDLVGLGYLGVDIVLDRARGPLVLELNARPGLSIQLANRDGLLTRLQRLAEQEKIPENASERAELAKTLFGRPEISFSARIDLSQMLV